MLYIIKWLVCVATAILAWSQADAYPGVWQRHVASLPETRSSMHEHPSLPGVCDSARCLQDAADILDALDTSVDPCEDFYMFSCGGWKEKNPPRNDTSVQVISDEKVEDLSAQIKLMLEDPASKDDISPLKAAKKMYQVCMDVDTIIRAGIQPLVDLSNKLGGWPMALEHWDEDTFTLESTLAEYERHLGWTPLFYTISFFNTNDTSRRFVQIAEDTGYIPSFDSLAPEYEESRAEYESLIVNTTLHIMNATGVNNNEESVFLQARHVFEFIEQLQNLSSETKADETLTLKKLQEWTDSALVANAFAQFNWLSFLNLILSDTEIVLDDTEEVLVIDTAYWIRLFQLLDNTPPRVIANYLQWSLINSYKNYTEMWMMERLTPNDTLTRSTHCLRETLRRFNHLMLSRVAPDIYDEIDKKHFDILVEDIRSELINSYSNTGITWLDDDSRSTIIERLETMKAYSGYPDLYKNVSALVDYYKQVNVSNDHFTNMLLESSEGFGRSLSFLRHPVYDGYDIWTFLIMPFADTAFYMSDSNHIVVAFGLLQSYYLEVGRLEAVHYGRLGTTIGHEMIHGVSRIYGDEWNSNMTKLYYQPQCFIEQYDKYHIPELEETGNTNITVNGSKTVEENVGDNYGMHAAYAAYQSYVEHHGTEQRLPGLEHFSPNQLFFISYGTSWCESRNKRGMKWYIGSRYVHAPSRARVSGSVSNMDPFASAFNCSTGSNMNPRNKCRLWGPAS